MSLAKLIGRVNAQGQIELDEPLNLPPGSVRIVIEAVDLVASEIETVDDARWDASFAASQDVLTRMAQAARQAYQNGQTVELDPDALLTN